MNPTKQQIAEALAELTASNYHTKERILRAALDAAEKQNAALETFSAQLQETVFAIRAVNVNEFGHIADEAIERLIRTCPESPAQFADRVAELEQWKSEAIKIMPDFQAIGKALAVPLGQSVHDKIFPSITRLQMQVERESAAVRSHAKLYTEYRQRAEAAETALSDANRQLAARDAELAGISKIFDDAQLLTSYSLDGGKTWIRHTLEDRVKIAAQTCALSENEIDQARIEDLLSQLGAVTKDSESAWQPIETAPRGEWFLALASSSYNTVRGCDIAVIHRIDGVGFGPWEGAEEAYYKADFFTHWMPLPNAPNAARKSP